MLWRNNMFERLDLIVERYNEINEMLQDSAVVCNVNKMTALMKEQRSLEKIVEKYKEYKDVVRTVKELKELAKENDPEIAEMAQMELEPLIGKDELIIDELKILLLPKDPNDEKNVIVEIRGAAGGEEGNIFAADLFRMYSKYAESRGWKIEVLDSNETGLGGFSLISFSISGDSIYSYMKFESGAHSPDV